MTRHDLKAFLDSLAGCFDLLNHAVDLVDAGNLAILPEVVQVELETAETQTPLVDTHPLDIVDLVLLGDQLDVLADLIRYL